MFIFDVNYLLCLDICFSDARQTQFDFFFCLMKLYFIQPLKFVISQLSKMHHTDMNYSSEGMIVHHEHLILAERIL